LDREGIGVQVWAWSSAIDTHGIGFRQEGDHHSGKKSERETAGVLASYQVSYHLPAGYASESETKPDNLKHETIASTLC